MNATAYSGRGGGRLEPAGDPRGERVGPHGTWNQHSPLVAHHPLEVGVAGGTAPRESSCFHVLPRAERYLVQVGEDRRKSTITYFYQPIIFTGNEIPLVARREMSLLWVDDARLHTIDGVRQRGHSGVWGNRDGVLASFRAGRTETERVLHPIKERLGGDSREQVQRDAQSRSSQSVRAPFDDRNVFTGGDVTGERINGVLGDGDWILAHPDVYGRLKLRGTIATADGAFLYLQYSAPRVHRGDARRRR